MTRHIAVRFVLFECVCCANDISSWMSCRIENNRSLVMDQPARFLRIVIFSVAKP